MRGDLVYEKLGEVDPSLLADALPDAVPTMRTNTLHVPPRKRLSTGWRIALVIAASLAMTVVLLAVGGASLFAGVTWPWESGVEETTPEDHFGEELTYGGTVSIEGFGSLTDSDDLVVIGNELQARFNAAAPVEDVCECLRDLSIQIGDTTLTYNRDHGCFRDGDTGLVYQLEEQDREYVNDLLDDLLPLPHILTFFYEYNTLRHGDDFVFSVGWWEGYGSVFEIENVYLRYEGEDTEYVTQGYFTVSAQNTYHIRIKDDAPYGKYTLVAHVYSPYTGRNIEMEIPSETGAIEIVPNEKEPAYDFDFDPAQMSVQTLFRNDTLSLNVALINLGVDIHRFGLNTILHPKAELRIQQDGESLSFALTDELIMDDGHQLRTIRSGETGDSVPYSLQITEELPAGVYDLVLSFEGHEKVIENVLEVNDTLVLCRGDSYGLFVSQAEPSTFVLRQGDYEIPFGRWDNLPVVTIPADAPAGSYDLVENGYLSFEGFLIVSDAENEHFSHNDLRKQTVQRGDWVEFDACVNVKGATIHAFMPYDSLDIEAVLVSIYGSPTSYTLTAMSAPDAREPNNYTFYPGETIIKSKTFIIPDDMPAGVYDLVVTFRGETKTYPKMITVVAP